jgi:tetratricopeptide (TPR) repeat protein
MRKLILAGIILPVALIILSGCGRRTPEERLEKAFNLLQQRDTLGAMLEAKDMIQKHPDDPRTVDARLLLAQVYMMDRKPDDALAELDHVLEKSDQKDQRGMMALRMYLDILKRNQRFEDASKMIDRYQKEYADDQMTSMQLTVARADIMTDAGQTSGARELLVDLIAVTTSPVEIRMFRELIGRTYIAEKAGAEAAAYFEAEYRKAADSEEKRDLALRTAWFHAFAGNYEATRTWTEDLTRLFDEALKDELDANAKTVMALTLGKAYGQVGNLAGARQVVRRLFDARTNPQLMPQVVNELATTMMRQGKPDDVIAFLREAAARYPESQLAEQAAQMETLKAQGKLDAVDTSPLVMKFAADPVIAPENLPEAAAGTSETVTMQAPVAESAGTSEPVADDAATSPSV